MKRSWIPYIFIAVIVVYSWSIIFIGVQRETELLENPPPLEVIPDGERITEIVAIRPGRDGKGTEFKFTDGTWKLRLPRPTTTNESLAVITESKITANGIDYEVEIIDGTWRMKELSSLEQK